MIENEDDVVARGKGEEKKGRRVGVGVGVMEGGRRGLLNSRTRGGRSTRLKTANDDSVEGGSIQIWRSLSSSYGRAGTCYGFLSYIA